MTTKKKKSTLARDRVLKTAKKNPKNKATAPIAPPVENKAAEPVIPTEKRLGKIISAEFGMVLPSQCGILLLMGSVHKDSTWSIAKGYVVPMTDFGSRENYLNAVVSLAFEPLVAILDRAEKKKVSQLVGLPIEAHFQGETLVSWRFLSEVL